VRAALMLDARDHAARDAEGVGCSVGISPSSRGVTPSKKPGVSTVSSARSGLWET
jgi:hypothetical protein